MDLAPALARYAHALGRWQVAWRFASPALRRAVALALVSAAWDAFRRDAGPGDVGREHHQTVGSISITGTHDPRRDGVLLWVADHGAAPIAEAAGLLARMVEARRHFGAADQELLQTAFEALSAGPFRGGSLSPLIPDSDAPGEDVLAPLRTVARAVDRLRRDTAFLEAGGSDVQHALPRGSFSHYVPADPGAAWALNLALLARGAPFSTVAPPPGLISRAVFREDLDPEDLAVDLGEGVTSALSNAFGVFEHLDVELGRGRTALDHLSRNARTEDAWALVAALRQTSRRQLARALGLSRAGADIQARALDASGLVTLRSGGGIDWIARRAPNAISAGVFDDVPSGAFAELDASMAELDRLIAPASHAR